VLQNVIQIKLGVSFQRIRHFLQRIVYSAIFPVLCFFVSRNKLIMPRVAKTPSRTFMYYKTNLESVPFPM